MNRHAQPPNEATIKRLTKLLERKRRTGATAQRAIDELCIAVYNACEVEGASRGEVAKALGVGKSTVQGWVNRGRHLR